MNREKFQKTDLRRSCLHLRLILSKYSAYTNNNNDKKKKRKKERMKKTKYKLQQTLRKEKNLISRVIILLDSSQKAYKQTGTYSPFKRKIYINRNSPWKDLMADILKKM